MGHPVYGPGRHVRPCCLLSLSSFLAPTTDGPIKEREGIEGDGVEKKIISPLVAVTMSVRRLVMFKDVQFDGGKGTFAAWGYVLRSDV